MRFFLFLIILPFVGAAQSPEIASFRGNWLKTDGSNLMHLGIYQQIVCYNNSVWKVNASSGVGDALRIEAESESRNAVLTIKRVDDNTIELTEGKRKVTLRNKRTFNPKFKPGKETFREAYGNSKIAKITGVIHSSWVKEAPFEDRYLTFQFHNELTNDIDYFMAEVDDQGRFNVALEVYRPQIVDIQSQRRTIGQFMVQPGTTTLLAINTSIEINANNPDFDLVTQRLNSMGEDAAFNNHYQHFIYYSATLDFPKLEFPKKSIAGKPTGEKKQLIFKWYADKREDVIKSLGYIYTSNNTEQRFIDFIKDEVKYQCASALNSNLRADYSEPDYNSFKIDSTDLARMRIDYLSDLSSSALLHAAFYDFTRGYISHAETLKFGNSRTYSIWPGKMTDRIVNEYGPLLSGNFVERYLELNRDRQLLQNMREADIIKKYFDGNEEEGRSYMYLQHRIEREFFQEAEDSIGYAFNQTAFRDPLLLYLANVTVLNDGNSDYKTPSVYRVKLFRRYAKDGAGPWLLVDSIRNANALLTGFGGIRAKTSSVITEVNDETSWQNTLAKYKGKVVVLWMFSHNFRKDHVTANLFELQRIRKLYAGKDVVFIKGLQERSRSDAPEHLLNYIQQFQLYHELSDAYYINGTVSVNADIGWAFNEAVIIYNEDGHVHRGRAPDRPVVIPGLTGELTNVLAGKGKYTEPIAPAYFPLASSRYGMSSTDRWTLQHISGRFQTYLYKEPERPDSRRPDTVFTQLKFGRDSVVLEQHLLLKKGKLPKDQVTSMLMGYDYRREHTEPFNAYKYTFDPSTCILTLRNLATEERRRYRVVNMSTEMMLLELLE